MPLVGLVWRGASYHENDSDRSISLTTLVRHLPPGFTYVSLQQGFQNGERIKAAPAAIKDFSPQLVNFDETAALVCHLNLVITVDTSVAHLSGAMGQRTWLLLPYALTGAGLPLGRTAPGSRICASIAKRAPGTGGMFCAGSEPI